MGLSSWRRLRAPVRLSGAALLVAAVLVSTPDASPASQSEGVAGAAGVVDVIHVEGPITPITVQQIERQISESHTRAARALVLVMDTPGGLVSSMRDIVQAILASPLPIITYVSPPGARAASAGLFIVTASHVAAMAPSTNLGAAAPVTMGGDMDTTLAKKASSDIAALIEGLAEARGRNVDWNVRAVRDAISAGATEAVELNVVDFIATDLREVLRLANGRTVDVAGQPTVLAVAEAELNEITPSLRHRVLSWIAHPNVAYLLLTLGFYGLLFELQAPGAILPGVAGVVLLILGFVAMQVLPVNVAGLLLILLAIAFFAIEVFVPSGGVLAVGGTIAFLIGSLILFQPGPDNVFRISLPVVLGTTLATGAFFTFVVGKGLAAQRRRVGTGLEGMIGKQGIALSELAPRGQVRVHGEIWEAESASPVAAGARVEVVRARGLTLDVSPPSGEES